MKSMKRVLAFALAAVMTAAMSLPALAADDDVQIVTVGKSGGSITITNTTKDKDYAIYKLFDATVVKEGVGQDGKGIAYTVPSGKTIEAPATDWFDAVTVGTGENEVTTVTAKDALTSAVLKSDDFKAWAESFGEQVGDIVTATNNSIKFDKIPYGYYYITSSLGAVLTVDSTTPNGVVIDKNQIPTPDNGDDNPGKVIVKDGKKATVSNASLMEGQTFDYGVNATNYEGEKKIWKYIITDELGEGMTYDMAGLKVTVGDAEIPAGGTNGYVITYKDAEGNPVQDAADAQSFRIELNWTDGGTLEAPHLYANAVELHVIYKAFLDPAKAEKVKSGSEPNENKANFKTLKDNDNPDDPDWIEPDPLYPDSKTKTYTTEIEISKVDDSGNALEGAQFTLSSIDGDGAKVVITIADEFVEDAQGSYWKLKDGSYTATDPNGDRINKDLYEDVNTKYRKLTKRQTAKGEGQTETSISAFVNEEGKVSFKGLGEGSYKLEETVVPAGFNKAEDIQFQIGFDAKTEKFSVESESEIVEDGNKLKVTIVNNKGVELPSTGGAGTTMFYIIGSILVIGAGIVLVAKRRMNLH